MKADFFANIHPAKLKFYLRVMTSWGYQPDAILEGTEITPSLLNDDFTLIEIPDYIKVVHNMMRLTQSPTLAFELGDALLPSDFGVFGHAFSSCQHFNDGVAFWHVYNRLFFGNLIKVHRFDEGNIANYEFIPLIKMVPHLLQFFMEEKFNIESTAFQTFNDTRITNLCSSFTYPAPAHAHIYDKKLKIKAQFKAPKNLHSHSITDEFYLKPFPAADRATHTLCTNYLDDLANTIQTRTNLTAKLRVAMREHLPNIITIDEIAQSLGYSKRKLFHCLEIEGTSYQVILADVRKSQVLNYLTTTFMNADEIATLVGFRNTSSLRRAFKAWTGVPLKQYKDQLNQYSSKKQTSDKT